MQFDVNQNISHPANLAEMESGLDIAHEPVELVVTPDAPNADALGQPSNSTQDVMTSVSSRVEKFHEDAHGEVAKQSVGRVGLELIKQKLCWRLRHLAAFPLSELRRQEPPAAPGTLMPFASGVWRADVV